jgi:hypothetical protein
VSAIKEAVIPKTLDGNDPNDQKDNPDFLDSLELVIDTDKPLIDLGILPKNIDTISIQKRPFVIDGRLLRGGVSCIAGPPGVGKSAFEIASMVSVASGHSYLGESIRETGIYWLYNNEEDNEELLRRYIGFCKFHNIVPSSLRANVRLSSGYGNPLIVAKKCQLTGEVIPTPNAPELIRHIKDQNIMVLSVDPIVSTHQTDENNNIESEQVMSIWRHIAFETNCAINLPAHISKIGQKNESDSFSGNMDAIRGASAVVGAARQVHTLARMGPATAKTYGILEEERIHMVRLDAAKGNYSPPADKSTWLKMCGQCLDNHPVNPDWIGVFTESEHEMIKTKGARDQKGMEGESSLRLALTRIDLNRGQSVAVVEVIEKLMNSTDRSKTWIYEWIPRYLKEHGSRDAEVKEVEFTWSKVTRKSGGRARLLIHREIHV